MIQLPYRDSNHTTHSGRQPSDQIARASEETLPTWQRNLTPSLTGSKANSSKGKPLFEIRPLQPRTHPQSHRKIDCLESTKQPTSELQFKSAAKNQQCFRNPQGTTVFVQFQVPLEYSPSKLPRSSSNSIPYRYAEAYRQIF